MLQVGPGKASSLLGQVLVMRELLLQVAAPCGVVLPGPLLLCRCGA